MNNILKLFADLCFIREELCHDMEEGRYQELLEKKNSIKAELNKLTGLTITETEENSNETI